MLSNETVEKTLELATKATEQNIKLLPETDTPLQELFDSTMLVNPGVITEPVATVSAESITEDLVADYVEETDNTAHNTNLDSLIDEVVTAVGTHLSFARNVVLNNVKEYAARVLKDVQTFEPNPISLFNIKQVRLPEVLTNPGFLAELNKAAGLSYIEPQGCAYYAMRGPNELLSLISYGSKSIDDSIRKWISQCDSGILVRAWDSFFADPLGRGTADVSFIDYIEKPIVGQDNALAIFLLSRAVLDKMPEGSGMGADELKKLMTQFMEISASRLLRVIGIQEQNDKQHLLVLMNVRDKSNTVYVNRNVYLDWIKTGGKNEIILGAYVKAMGLSTVDQFAEKADEAIKAWDNYVNIATAQSKNTRYNQFLDSLRTHFFVMLKTREEIEEDMFKVPSHIDEVAKHFNDELQNVSAADMDRVPEICCTLMCKGRYYYTDAFSILSDIDLITREHPEMDVKDAALLATINYVTDYVCDQIKVFK